jgi:hypothetical protein
LKQSLFPLFSSQSDNDDFLDRLAEVEEAGGDPFFLQDGNEEGANDPDDGFIENPDQGEEIIAQIEAVGGDPFFLSHDVEDDSLADINPSDAVTDEGLPAESIMMMMAMSAGGGDVMDLIEKSNESQDPPSSSVTVGKEQEPEYVSFNDRISEVKAAGGDPFFLSDEENGAKPEATSTTSFEDRMSEIEDMGGDSFFLSDGEAIEPVDSCDEEEEEDPVLFSEACMAIAMSAGGGGVMDLISEENQDPPTFPSIKTAEESDASDDAEGGDPSFLSGDEKGGRDGDLDQMAEIEAMGGDAFFL